MTGYEPGDSWWMSPRERPFLEEVGEPSGTLRVAVTATPPIDVPVDPECVAAVTSAAALLSDLGHDLIERTPPWREPDLALTFIGVWRVGAALHPVDDLSLLTPLNRELVEAARTTSGRRLRARGRPAPALRPARRRVLERGRRRAHADARAPTRPDRVAGAGCRRRGRAAPSEHGVHAVTPRSRTSPASPRSRCHSAGAKTGSRSASRRSARPAADALLVRLASQIEEAQPWADRRPPVT